MEGVKNWEKMTWQERREERFKSWLNPPDVKFVSKEAERLYKERVTRFIKVIKLEEPDRVPCILPVGYFPAYHAGVNFHAVMYDYGELRRAWLKFMKDFGDMDSFSSPSLILPGKIMEGVDNKTEKWPGHGLAEDACYFQYIEQEYMKANEYDLIMMDPTDYLVRVHLPRTAGLYEPLKKLPPLSSLRGGRVGWVPLFADPEIRRVFQTMIDLADDYVKWRSAVQDVSQTALTEGYPSFHGGGFMAGPPFDYFADTMRGTRGIVMDMFRQPKKLHEAMEYWLNLTINKSVKNFPMTSCPVCSMPLHKGDDTFMSEKQFEEFYWPYLRRVFLAMIDEGLVPMPFAEGRYNNRLKQIADTPRSSVVWYFDQTDMKEAKKVLGNNSCIVGNLPTSIMMTGTTGQVKDNCRKLIEDCAAGGGYILAGGASINNGKMENLHAMMDAAKEYGVYQKDYAKIRK